MQSPQPSNDLVGEPLLTDERLGRIENQIRRDYPSLPEYCTFVSYVQPEQWARVRGIDVQIPQTAVLAILVTNFRHRDSFRIFRAGVALDVWRKWDWATRHDADVRVDPAYRALKALVPEILSWDHNLRSLLN